MMTAEHIVYWSVYFDLAEFSKKEMTISGIRNEKTLELAKGVITKCDRDVDKIIEFIKRTDKLDDQWYTGWSGMKPGRIKALFSLLNQRQAWSARLSFEVEMYARIVPAQTSFLDYSEDE